MRTVLEFLDVDWELGVPLAVEVQGTFVYAATAGIFGPAGQGQIIQYRRSHAYVITAVNTTGARDNRGPVVVRSS